MHGSKDDNYKLPANLDWPISLLFWQLVDLARFQLTCPLLTEQVSRKRASPPDSGWLLGTLHTCEFAHSPPKNLFVWERACFGGLQSCMLPITYVDRCHESPCCGQSVYYCAFQTYFFAVALFSSDSDSHQFVPPSLVGSTCQLEPKVICLVFI